MGVYLVDVGAEDWRAEYEGGYGEIAAALDERLSARGLPQYEVPAACQGLEFEEKLSPSMDGFVELCHAQLTRDEEEMLCGWSVLVPVPLDEPVDLPVGSAYTDTTVVAGAPQVLALAQRLAAAIGLPPMLPVSRTNLGLTNWFLDGQAQETAAARPGPWDEDLDAAFYVALYLRAAQHSLRRGCPIVFS
ncbi:hypothetical protein [Streptomyces justiciae]|uniref:DUF1877 family protein n=1 Tax=Streptomyces justiciae TaxID=2780140 RepID=A0ABU3LMU4_9ACTN|nr:hypothetical protein [Streptomyces justiciae]MDT7840555.1 hypothetical protein [Streptomyces justiciae]